MKSWFYCGFIKRFKLLHKRLAVSSRKLPADWIIKVAIIIIRVESSQFYKRCGNNLVPPVLDRNVVNTVHVPFYRDMVGMHSWSKTGAEGNTKRNVVPRLEQVALIKTVLRYSYQSQKMAPSFHRT